MGPQIILDKSSIQSLNLEEIDILRQFYLPVTVPVQVAELLGDLGKPSARMPAQQEVAQIARKIRRTGAPINTHYASAISASLIGERVPMERRPIIQGGRSVASGSEHGIIFEPTPEERALLRWDEGRFSDAEEAIGERWRESTRRFDLEAVRRAISTLHPTVLTFKDLSALARSLTTLFDAPHMQTELLKQLMTEFNTPIEVAQRAFHRWESSPSTKLETFAPYARFCYYTTLLFQLALGAGFIGTKATNRIDLEYLFYLPFAMVFSSSDRFHEKMAPLLLQKNQVFVPGIELKADLAALAKARKSRDTSGSTKGLDATFLLDRPEGLTAKLWAQLMAPGAMNQRNLAAGNTGEIGSKLLEFIQKKVAAARPATDREGLDTDSADFVLRKSTFLRTDPCPCGSGMPYYQCHEKK